MKKTQRGFTLIELLVVIAIIGLLATIAVVSLNTARSKSKNTKIVADIRQVRNALEMFYNDWAAYPGSITFNSATATSKISSGTDYMTVTPYYPSGATAWNYISTGTASSSYIITFGFEGTYTYNGTNVSRGTATPQGLTFGN